ADGLQLVPLVPAPFFVPPCPLGLRQPLQPGQAAPERLHFLKEEGVQFLRGRVATRVGGHGLAGPVLPLRCGPEGGRRWPPGSIASALLSPPTVHPACQDLRPFAPERPWSRMLVHGGGAGAERPGCPARNGKLRFTGCCGTVQ